MTRSLPPKSWKQGHELINDGDERHIMDSHFGVIDHNHPVGVIAFNTIDSGSARGHESTVGIQLAQLARPDFHVQHDPPAQRLTKIFPDERKLCLAAHAVGALECHISVWASAKVQRDTLGAEHTLRFLLANGMTVLRGIPVEDIAEIYVANHVRQVADERVLHRFLVVVPMHNTHSLKEQRAVLLLMERGKYLALLRCFSI